MSGMDGPLVPDVRRILVMRPSPIGDFMFALPALHALRIAYPQAHIALIGKPWQARFLAGRPGPVDEVLVMPAFPGIGAAPDSAPDAEAQAFLEMLRARRFDLALQMYGGGRHSNPFIRSVGARVTAGTAAPEAVHLDRTIAYRPHSNHSLNLLQVAALVGAAPCIPELGLCVTEQDREEGARVLPPTPDERLVVLHPGVTDPRRRWAPERFAAVADALAERGARIVLSGGAADADAVGAVASAMRHAPAKLHGELSLGAMCGVLERSRLILANDTGPLHMALALGTEAVGIFWFTNLVESGTLWPQRLSPAVSPRVHCPRCGVENLRQHCGHEVSFVDDVRTEDVAALALRVYAGAS